MRGKPWLEQDYRLAEGFGVKTSADPGGPHDFSMPATLINVSNRLPVVVAENEITRSPGGLVAALENLGGDDLSLKWIGWPGGQVSDPDRQREVERVLAKEHRSIPVFLTEEEVEGHYRGLSNSSIWPLLHYMPSKFRYESAWWRSYHDVNRKFADKVLTIAKEGDLVWVHDYQLMLVPAMLRAAMPSLRIGFFLHTPFPSYEVFRCHPKRNELAGGLLGADLIGFHTFGYLRHYRSSVLRLLGIESEIMRIRHDGRTSRLGVYPIGINAQRFAEAMDAPDFQQQADRFRETFAGKRLVLSVERLDYTKGILHRLEAIDVFLASHPEMRDKIKFIFVSVPSRGGVPEYQALREEVQSRVGHINGRYTTLSNAPVHFIHGTVQFAELTALYAIADVALVTPLIDGMNLVSKEYIATQRDHPGVLVLSEFAGAAEELFNALIVNPYDASQVAQAIADGLVMCPEERSDRMMPMRERVMTFDARTWARSFINDLKSAPMGGDSVPDPADAKARIRTALAEGQRVAMFLDYDGTLREIEKSPDAARPNTGVVALLDHLRARENLDVTIISGRTPRDLEAFLGTYPFGLIAEHGAFLRRPGSAEWEQLDRNASYRWKDELLRVLKIYADSTPGSFIENKRTSLVWHYRRADPEFGGWKAKQLADELAAMTASDPVQVRHGRKIVEIAAAQVNKGAAVMNVAAEKSYDLIVCAGDDSTDESMFSLPLKNQVTIKVGDRETRAQYRLPTPGALRRFIEEAIAL
jgi:trehalose 6-phosphate synthase/phosphatase